MANRTRNQLSTDSLGLFPDNTSQLITPQDLRDWITNGIESFVTQKDKSTFENAFYENRGNAITATSGTTDLSLANGNFVHITGTGSISITSFGTVPAGSRFVLCFDIAVTLVYNATSLIIPGAANVTTAAGDCIMLISEGLGNWRVISYFPSGGIPVGTVTSVTASTPLASSGGNAPNISLTGIIPVANGGSGTATPSLVAGTNVTISGSWPNQTINASGGGGGSVTAVTASAPLSSSGGTAPDISIPKADASTDGYLDNADFSAFAAKQDALSAGTGISIISNTVTNTAPDQTVSLTPGTGIGVTGSYPSFTISNTAPSSGGTVQSVSGTGTVNGITLTGTVTNTGNLTLGGTLSNVNLGSQVTGTLPIVNGGTGTTTPSLVAGSNVTITGSWPNQTIAASGGGGGSGTVNSGTSTRLAYYASTGTAVSETTNMAIDNTNGRMNVGATGVPAARVQTAAGTAANGQLLLTPSTLSGALNGTIDGTIWYDTTSNNSSLYLRKLFASATSILTKFITLDRNPDFSSGGSGIVQSDANGTLTKGADLTALGIYAQTNTPTAITTGSGSLIGTVTGVTTLPTNFFGTGKTIAFYLSGLISMANSGGPLVAIDFRITDGTTTVTLATLSYDTTNLTNRVYVIDTSITCRSSGSNPVFGVAGKMIVNHTAKDQETVFITPAAVTATSLNTSSALTLQVVATWTNPGTTSSISSIVNYCHYLN